MSRPSTWRDRLKAFALGTNNKSLSRSDAQAAIEALAASEARWERLAEALRLALPILDDALASFQSDMPPSD